jgi:hypothetical protein
VRGSLERRLLRAKRAQRCHDLQLTIWRPDTSREARGAAVDALQVVAGGSYEKFGDLEFGSLR